MPTATCRCGETIVDDRWEKLDEIIEKHRAKQGALIPILHEAQELFGCLSEDVQLKVAHALGISPAEVYGVATFYSFFTLKPRGKHKIAVCLGTACYVRGASELVRALKEELGVEVNGTTKDGRFTLEVVRCLGACGLAPVMMIGDNVYGRVKPEKIPEILKEYQ
ncbi:MAG TPA: NADH-quinone oxidoreductase subunit NuoE [Firmicutes bacterium]|nr:NADH-quinone oxidoreductase subunit NuoE [Bacillota bacterium]